MSTPKKKSATIQAIEPTLSRGHKKKERTRKKLIESAVELLGTRDVGDFTLLGLAEAAEMSNGTVYNYFSTKDEVLDAVAIELASRFSSTVRVLGESTTCGAERVSLGTRMYIQRAKEDPQWAKALVRLVNFHVGLNSAVASFISSDIHAGVVEGDFELQDENLAMNMLVASGLLGMRSVIEGTASETIGEDLAFMILRAFGMKSRDATRIVKQPLPVVKVEKEPAPIRKRGRPKKVA